MRFDVGSRRSLQTEGGRRGGVVVVSHSRLHGRIVLNDVFCEC